MKGLLKKLKKLQTWCSFGFHDWELRRLQTDTKHIFIGFHCKRCGKIKIIGEE
jgi:hypothetical protein